MMQTPVTREPEKAAAAGGGPLGVERYAEVLAHVVYFKISSRPEVLQRLGIDPSAWAAADTKWMQALVDEALEDEHPVAAAFAAAFAPVLKRLKVEKPSIDSIGTPPTPLPPPKEEARPAAPVLPLPVAEPPAPAVGTELPTYLLPSRPPVPARSPLAATSLALDVPLGPALPFATKAHETSPQPTSPSSAADMPSQAGQPPAPPPPPAAPGPLPIESLPVAKPPAPVLPTEQPTYLVPSRPPVAARSPLAATSLALDLPVGPALPFAKKAYDPSPVPPPTPPSPSGAAANPAPAPTALPRVNKAPASLTGTSLAFDLPLGAALPFAKTTGAEPPAPSPPTPSVSSNAGNNAPAPAAPALPRVQKAPAHLTGTMSVSDLPVAAALPFAQGAAGEPPPLTLEQYAALRANLTVKGEEDAATWKQFGIASQAMKEALQARFAATFRDDAGARDRFVALLQRMVNDLRVKPGA